MSDLIIGRVRCASCGGVFKGHIILKGGGDGSRLAPYRHKRKNPNKIFTTVWCFGHLIVGRDVTE